MRATIASTDRSPQQVYECTVWRSCIGSTSPSLTLANSKIIGMKSAAATVLYLLFCVPLAQAEPPGSSGLKFAAPSCTRSNLPRASRSCGARPIASQRRISVSS